MTDTTTSNVPLGSDDEQRRPPRHQALDIWDQFITHKGALAGLIIFVIILFMVFILPEFWLWEPQEKNLRARNLGPTWAHPMGTDQLGRDTFSQVLSGGRISLAGA